MFCRARFLLAVCCLGLASACVFRELVAEDRMDPTTSRPNILLIMSDDMGYSDIGPYGSEIETPALDRLAAEGLRFTQFYNCARCCPTRASLMTGLYPHQAGMGLMTSDLGWPSYQGQLHDRCQTIAEVLRAAGYRCYLSGKWHLSRNTSPTGDKSAWPRQRGFEKFYGTIIGAGSFFDPTTLCRDNTYITPDNDPRYSPAEYYYTHAITDNALEFLRQHLADAQTGNDQPFFLYVSYTAAHWPLHALPADIEKYRGKYDDGFAAVRDERHRRGLQIGVMDPQWKLSPAPQAWEDAPDHAWQARCMEVYAAQVDAMDQGIGRLVDHMAESGQLENTVIFFLQDNGGCAEGMGRQSNQDRLPESRSSPMGKNELQPKIWPPMITRAGKAVRTGPQVMPGPADTYVAYGQSWANVSNTPFRHYKHFAHEGGISSPLIIHWPKGLPEQQRGRYSA